MSPEAQILAGLDDMYDAFLAGDRARFDVHLDAAVTTWESGLPGLLDRARLDAMRDARAPGRPGGISRLQVDPQQVDVWGEHAVARYLLTVHPEQGEQERARVTDVLRRDGAGWRIVHHHAETRPGAWGEA